LQELEGVVQQQPLFGSFTIDIGIDNNATELKEQFV
jgi:hypothetical protein